MRRGGKTAVQPHLLSLILCWAVLGFADTGASAFQSKPVAVVARVYDGDTVRTADGRQIRYIGINAPEVGNQKGETEPYGRLAKQLNRRLTLNREVRLEFGMEKRDHYGRWLAHVVLPDGTLVGRALLARGLAYVLVRHPNVQHRGLLLASQRRAMSEQAGMWANWGGKEGVWIGNRRSMRFHLPTCPFGRRTASSSRVQFDRLWEAFWHGYAPCKKCRPWTFSDLKFHDSGKSGMVNSYSP